MSTPRTDQESRGTGDIESQLDALLAQIESEEKPAAGSHGGAAPASESRRSPASTTAVAEIQSTGAAGDTEDHLAQQIQQMLDDTGAAQDPGEPLEGSFDAPEQVHIGASSHPQPEFSSQAVAELDRILASSANDAVAGDFETLEDVVGDGMAQPSAVAASAPLIKTPSADDEDRLHADFQAPESVLTQQPGAPTAPPAAAFTAGAADVDRELKQDEAGQAVTAPQVAHAAVAPEFGVHRQPLLRRATAAVAAIVPRTARSACEAINRPLHRLSPESRNLVGYVGLLTLFNASVLLIYKLLTTLWSSGGGGGAQ